ncbi:penicillin-binding protein activator LpoB [Owenweeksia hongkongensis]|uniref:penicillin-binding protein activator LpoB n=1 Tax=Owenweeksia hongkongensis TaxID=253245 RepID=UPI003A94C1CA
MKIRIIAAALVLAGVAASCDTSKSVTRVDEREQIDLSGRWNDVDSRLVAAEMVNDGLNRVWLQDFVEAEGRKPAIIVGLVRNRSSEHIATETFINDIEREYINSGKVRLVQGGEFREELRVEKADQQNNASLETVKRFGRELGADFIMQGSVNSITDANSKTKVVFYQVDMELTNIETNEKVWVGSKKIKKVVE